MNDPITPTTRTPDARMHHHDAGPMTDEARRPDRRREDLVAGLQERGAKLTGDLAHWDHLTRDARALRPAVLDELERRIEGMRLACDVEWALQDVDVAELLDDLVIPFIRARVPLRARAEATAWAHECVLGILDRFHVGGTVPERMDTEGRPATGVVNTPSTVVRVALAAGWLAWSHLLVDPRASRAHLMVSAKAIDVIDDGLSRKSWEPTARELDLALASVVLERRLLRHGRAAALAAAY